MKPWFVVNAFRNGIRPATWQGWGLMAAMALWGIGGLVVVLKNIPTGSSTPMLLWIGGIWVLASTLRRNSPPPEKAWPHSYRRR